MSTSFPLDNARVRFAGDTNIGRKRDHNEDSIALPETGERLAIVIPDRYIDTRYGADYVRLSRKGGATIEAPVQRGARVPLEDMPDGVEILSGLRTGDVILPVEHAS